MTTVEEPRRQQATETEAYRVWALSPEGAFEVVAFGLTLAEAKRLYHRVANERGPQLKDFGWEEES